MSASTRIQEQGDDSRPLNTSQWGTSEETLANPEPARQFCTCGNTRCATWIRRATAADRRGRRHRITVVEAPTAASEVSRLQPRPRVKRFLRMLDRTFGQAEPLGVFDMGHSTPRRWSRRRRSVERLEEDGEDLQEAAQQRDLNAGRRAEGIGSALPMGLWSG